MTHDPLCPNIPEHWDGQILWPSRCDCDLIAKVRDDERQKNMAQVADVLTTYYKEPRPYVIELALKMIAHDLGVEIGKP